MKYFLAAHPVKDKAKSRLFFAEIISWKNISRTIKTLWWNIINERFPRFKIKYYKDVELNTTHVELTFNTKKNNYNRNDVRIFLREFWKIIFFYI